MFTATAAHATMGDPNVTVKGGAGCKQFLYHPYSVTWVMSNSEVAFSLYNFFGYSVSFHDIAPEGTPGLVTVRCVTRSGAHYDWQRAFTVFRPPNGTSESINLGAG